MVKPKQKREKRKSGENSCPLWMTTLGDAMSLLLTFFILLMTFSTPHTAKLMEVVGVIQGALGAVPSVKGAPDVPEKPEDEKPPEETLRGVDLDDPKLPLEASPVLLTPGELQNRFSEFERKLASLGMANLVTISILDDGLKVNLPPASMLFRGDTAELNPTFAGLVLQGVANLAVYGGNELRIVACLVPDTTVDRPGPAAGSWDLAYRRSLAISRFLSSTFPLNRNRISYGLRVLPPESTEETYEIILMQKIGRLEVGLKELWRHFQYPSGNIQ